MVRLRFLDEFARTLSAVAVLPPLLLLLSIAALLARLLGARPSGVNWAYQLFAHSSVAISGARVKVYGKEILQPGHAYVLVSNHESNLDPFAILYGLRDLAIRFVIKREIMQLPVIGHALAFTGNASVERTQGSGDVRRLQQALSKRDPEISLLFFAEGTRSKDGRLHKFKKGAFATAIATGLPVLPLGIAGSYFMLRPGTSWLRRGGIAIEIGPPIPVTEQTKRESLRDETFAAVAKLRLQARSRLRAAGLDPGGCDH
jgi:1-acyl-sn-glycerol-3-phosphate acyltransferase